MRQRRSQQEKEGEREGNGEGVKIPQTQYRTYVKLPKPYFFLKEFKFREIVV